MDESELAKMNKQEREALDYIDMHPRGLRHNIATEILENPEGRGQPVKKNYLEKSWVAKGERGRLFLDDNESESLVDKIPKPYIRSEHVEEQAEGRNISQEDAIKRLENVSNQQKEEQETIKQKLHPRFEYAL